jgi:hypothetical protein
MFTMAAPKLSTPVVEDQPETNAVLVSSDTNTLATNTPTKEAIQAVAAAQSEAAKITALARHESIPSNWEIKIIEGEKEIKSFLNTVTRRLFKGTTAEFSKLLKEIGLNR